MSVAVAVIRIGIAKGAGFAIHRKFAVVNLVQAVLPVEAADCGVEINGRALQIIKALDISFASVEAAKSAADIGDPFLVFVVGPKPEGVRKTVNEATYKVARV